MMGAVLCFPSTARLLRRRPNTKDVSSRRVALRNRLPIPDLQPPPPRTPQTSLRDANQPVRVLVLASASSSIHLRQAVISRLFLSTRHPPHRSSRFSAAATLSSPSFQSICRNPPRLQDSGCSARMPSFRIPTFLVRAERHCGMPS